MNYQRGTIHTIQYQWKVWKAAFGKHGKATRQWSAQPWEGGGEDDDGELKWLHAANTGLDWPYSAQD